MEQKSNSLGELAVQEGELDSTNPQLTRSAGESSTMQNPASNSADSADSANPAAGSQAHDDLWDLDEILKHKDIALALRNMLGDC